jgi:hypothetical protein
LIIVASNQFDQRPLAIKPGGWATLPDLGASLERACRWQTIRSKKSETGCARSYEEPEGGEPPIIGTLYLQKWATHRIEDPETITVTVEAAQSLSPA